MGPLWNPERSTSASVHVPAVPLLSFNFRDLAQKVPFDLAHLFHTYLTKSDHVGGSRIRSRTADRSPGRDDGENGRGTSFHPQWASAAWLVGSESGLWDPRFVTPRPGGLCSRTRGLTSQERRCRDDLPESPAKKKKFLISRCPQTSDGWIWMDLSDQVESGSSESKFETLGLRFVSKGPGLRSSPVEQHRRTYRLSATSRNRHDRFPQLKRNKNG